jgi:DNA-binding GntR family transcriptional regulator
VRPERVASELDISSTPAREALQLLRSEGFLELVPRKGFAVARITGADILDMFLAGAFVAGELASRAADQITPAGIKVLEEIHGQLSKAAQTGDLDAMEASNFQFHEAINQASDSPRLAWLSQLMSRYSPRRFYSSIEGWPEITLEDHAGLLDAIRNHDAVRARAEMEEHVRRSGRQLARHVDRRLAGGQPGAQDAVGLVVDLQHAAQVP